MLPPVKRKLHRTFQSYFKVGLLWTMATPAKCFCHHLERDWMFVNVMHVFLSAYKRSLLLSVFTFEPIPFIKPSCELMLSFAYSLRLLCSSCHPILRHFSYHLTVASALVAKMRTKSTTRIVSHFCVRCCLLFTVRAHVQPPLPSIREEESTRRWNSHRHFVEHLSPISMLHHTLCSNDTYSNI